MKKNDKDKTVERNDAFFFYKKDSHYSTVSPYHPPQAFPEYPFSQEIISNENDVYAMIRQMFYLNGYDSEYYGTKKWNPLGEYIKPGNTVLIKPNLVMHCNPTEENVQKGLDCLITHPAVSRCIFDYVYIALKGRGKIYIADAPVQDCDFDTLMKISGYGELFAFMEGKASEQLIIKSGDLRDTIMLKNGGRQRQVERKDKEFDSVVVDLKDNSAFHNLKKTGKLRITNYAGKDTVVHHSRGRNEYCISQVALDADVIISLPKPKSHRIAGYTGALKNFVGINARKEYLPHHRKGSVNSGGDEYQYSHAILKFFNSTGNDLKNWCLKHSFHKAVDVLNEFCRRTGKKLDKLEKGRKKFGMWYGNDTIWRTILDINYIIKFCDKNGVLQNTMQRKLLYIGDMLIGGEKEGPLEPTYKKVGGFLLSDDPVIFDLFLIKLMGGWDYNKFPTIKNAVTDSKLLNQDGTLCDLELGSNDEAFQGTLEDLNQSFAWKLTSGWQIN